MYYKQFIAYKQDKTIFVFLTIRFRTKHAYIFLSAYINLVNLYTSISIISTNFLSIFKIKTSNFGAYNYRCSFYRSTISPYLHLKNSCKYITGERHLLSPRSKTKVTSNIRIQKKIPHNLFLHTNTHRDPFSNIYLLIQSSIINIFLRTPT